MRLTRVEVRRLFARRVVGYLRLRVVAGLAVTLGFTAYDSREPSAADRAQAEAQAADARLHLPPIDEQIKECEVQERSAGVPAGEFGCQRIPEPRAEDFLLDKTFRFRAEIEDRVTGFAIVLALFGFVVGASFIGAEWAAGTLSALLTWEPRWIRILLAKVLGLAIVLTIAGVFVLTADIAGHAGVAAWRGDTSGVTDGLLMSTGLTALRGVALAIAAALIGFAIAGTTRNTAAALGAGFAYFLGAELVVRNFWHDSVRWLLTSNVAAWLFDGTRIPVATECPPGSDSCLSKEVALSIGDSAVYFGVVVGALLLICAVVFRRRDVS